MTGPRSFIFLNKEGSLAELGWDGTQREKLWRYNQHYFDDLNAMDAPARQVWHTALLGEWMVANSPGMGTGWEPYPLSLRVVNWIKWALGGAALSHDLIQSLAVQVRWLSRRLEVHLLGNHLFANAKALVLAGLFFEGPEADAWLEKGLRILAREMPEQLLPDGGHFERSTMYQALVLEDMLDLVNATRCFSARLSPTQQRQMADWPQRARSMQAWLHNMCHTDREISFFNDAAFGIAPSVAELNAYAHRVLPELPTPPVISCFHMPDSGYVRLLHGRAVALLDVAPVGPEYLPGHAHADTLSFELSVWEQRILVNSGTSCYGSSDERLRQRGTAAHNTVVVDDQNSSEVWGGFRVARRAYPMALRIQHEAEKSATEVICEHNGYCRLPGKPIHHRIWHMTEKNFTVIDHVNGKFGAAEARFHFHPDLKIESSHNLKHGAALLSCGKTVTWQLEHGDPRLERSTWHPRFGCSLPNVCLVINLIDGFSKLRFNW